MTTEEQMTIEERYKYLRMMKARYVKADRQKRGRLLDEMEAVTGQHRKSLIRRVNSSMQRGTRGRERERSYGADVTAAIKVVAASMDDPCAERLTPNLKWMAEHLSEFGELEVSDALLEQLGQISISTVRRRLEMIRQDQPRRRRRKPPRLTNNARKDVPMGRIAWDVQEPGHFEADTVHHCGPSASGLYVHTLQMVDVASGWTERKAVLGRSYVVMQEVMRVIEKTIVSGPGERTRIRRRYDDAHTPPFDRLRATQALSPEQLARLTALRERTNPRLLLAQINEQLSHIFSLPCAQPEESQNVYDMLSHLPDPRQDDTVTR